MKKIVHKLFNTKASSIDEENKRVTFVISTNEEDRYGEVVDQKSWNFKSYLKNPLVLWGHDPEEPENVLGTASSLKIAADGSQTTAELTFDSDINPKADLIFNQIRKGTLRTVSVGFINHTFNVEKDVPVLSDNELLEISVVPIPANSGAVALSLKAGEINRKDAKWLMDSMRKEADLMQEQYEACTERTNKEKTKSMTPEQAQAVIDGMSKLTEKVDTLTTENQALRDQVEALKPAEETDDERSAREAKEAEAKAEADKKAADEAEAKRIEDEKAKEDLAKSGDNDQDGAKETDDLDDDAELTPELQAKIDAELAEAVA